MQPGTDNGGTKRDVVVAVGVEESNTLCSVIGIMKNMDDIYVQFLVCSWLGN